VALNQQAIILSSMEMGMLIITKGQAFSYIRIISAVKRVEFVSDRMSYITLRGRWCDIIVLHVHAPTEDKCDVQRTAFMRN
jgi:hypothetical protein